MIVGHPAARRTAVVLLHGLCSTPDELRPVESSLRSLGYAIHPLSIAGYSFDTDAAVQRATPFAGWIDAIEQRIDALRASHDRVLLIGISAGASLALAAAIRCGRRVDALVLMSTTLRFDGWSVPRRQFLLPLALYTPLGRFWKYRERPPYGVKNERVRAWIERELRTRRISSAGSSVRMTSPLTVQRELRCWQLKWMFNYLDWKPRLAIGPGQLASCQPQRPRSHAG